MASSYGDPAIWGAIAVIGVLTFSIRLSFIALFGAVSEIPPWVERTLRFVPAAVLAALVAPSVITVAPETGELAVDRLVGGGVAAVVAWRTEDVLATMLAGMGALWTVGFVL